MKTFLLLLTAVACGLYAQAPAPASAITPGTLVPPAESFNATLHNVESLMTNLVQAMPADKFSFAPSPSLFVPSQKTEYTGVRTFGALVIHVAQANYGIAGPVGGGMKPDIDPHSLATLKDKDEIIAALTASFAFVHKAFDTLTPDNAFQSVRGPSTRATQAAFVMVHIGDEYGQMTEYLRMNGLIPPASQKK